MGTVISSSDGACSVWIARIKEEVVLPSELHRIWAVSDPLLRAFVPLISGLMRRELIRSGGERHEVYINRVPINYYVSRVVAQRRAGIFSKSSSSNSALPVLLVHGLADNALTWTFVMRLLARWRDLYAIDLPGYGLSGLPPGQTHATLSDMREVLQLFLGQVVGRPALVVGNSMGAWLAVRLAWAMPTMVAGVVLINAGGAPLQGRPSWEPFAQTITVPDLVTSRLVLRQLFGSIPAPLLYLGQRGLQELFQRRVVQRFVEDVQDHEFLVTDDLQHLPVPAGLIWGCRDRFLPNGSQEFFVSNLASAPNLLLKRCGHLPQCEQPLAVARFLHRFAEQCERQSVRP